MRRSTRGPHHVPAYDRSRAHDTGGKHVAEQGRIAVRVDPATGQKLFDTRVTRASERVDGHGYEVVDDAELDIAPSVQGRRGVQRGGAGAVPGLQRGTPRLGGLHGDGRPVLPLPRGPLLGPAGGARGAYRRVRDPRRWRRVRRALALVQVVPGRVRRHPLLREGRRRRWDVVLEPLSRHRLRRRVVLVPPAARGDGVHPDDEVRVGVRDLRVLPADRGSEPASTTTVSSTRRSSARNGTRRRGGGR